MSSSPSDPKWPSMQAALGQSFRFEQGASLHVGLLGAIARPTGPHDEAPFLGGVSSGGQSQCGLDLRQIHPDSDQDAVPLPLWFSDDRVAVDLSSAFDGAPAEALEGSGIPEAVVDGAVEMTRFGDAGDGGVALLAQMCGGKLAIDPVALVELIVSENVINFVEREGDDFGPLRAFNAEMPIRSFLDEVGLTSTALLSQISMLGFDLRAELGPDAVRRFEDHVDVGPVELAWFIDESDQIHTAQAVLTLTSFFTELFTSDAIIEQLAAIEQRQPDEIRAFVNEAAEAGMLTYVNAIWQRCDFLDEVDPIEWPDAVDISDSVAAQAVALREQADATFAASPDQPDRTH